VCTCLYLSICPLVPTNAASPTTRRTVSSIEKRRPEACRAT
jgi:hypothetical protein